MSIHIIWLFTAPAGPGALLSCITSLYLFISICNITVKIISFMYRAVCGGPSEMARRCMLLGVRASCKLLMPLQ